MAKRPVKKAKTVKAKTSTGSVKKAKSVKKKVVSTTKTVKKTAVLSKPKKVVKKSTPKKPAVPKKAVMPKVKTTVKKAPTQKVKKTKVVAPKAPAKKVPAKLKLVKPVPKKNPSKTEKPKASLTVTKSFIKKSTSINTMKAVSPKTQKAKKSVLPKTPRVPVIIPPEEHDENYMSDIQKQHFKKILIDWKKQLLEEMERTVHHMQDDASILSDPNDRATQEEEFSLELRARDRELKLIKKIEEALERIDNDDYGFCEACGVKIGAKRLEARPTATLCIDCKTIDEIREKHFG